MQSLSRRLKRGNAIMYYDYALKSIQVMNKLGNKKLFKELSKTNRLESQEQKYIDNVTKPLSRSKQ